MCESLSSHTSLRLLSVVCAMPLASISTYLESVELGHISTNSHVNPPPPPLQMLKVNIPLNIPLKSAFVYKLSAMSCH